MVRGLAGKEERFGYGLGQNRKSNEHRTGPFDRTSYRQRNTIEQLIDCYKQFRRIATRYEKRAANYQAMWLIATIVLWLGFANTPQYTPVVPLLARADRSRGPNRGGRFPESVHCGSPAAYVSASDC